jgi:hypothetical protein
MSLQKLSQHLAARGQHHQAHAQAHQQAHQGFAPLRASLIAEGLACIAKWRWALCSEQSGTPSHGPVKAMDAQ